MKLYSNIYVDKTACHMQNDHYPLISELLPFD